MKGGLTSLQVALFDSSMNNYVNLNYGRLMKKEPKVKDLELLEKVLKSKGLSDYYDDCSTEIRHYKDVIGTCIDSHYYVEYFGLSENTRKYIITLDFSNCLDLVISFITGCSPTKLRQIENYDKVSNAILNLDIDNLNIGLDTFTFVDPKISGYLKKLYDSTNGETEFVRKMFEEILAAMLRIVKYVAFYIQKNTDSVVRSISKQSVVLTSNVPLTDDELTIHYSAMDGSVYDYKIKIIQREKGDVV